MDEFLSMLPFAFVAMAASKRGIEAGRAYVKAFLDDSLFVRGLKGMRTKLAAFGSGLAKIGGATFGAGLIAGAAGLAKVVESIGDVAAIDKIGKAFGIAAEQATGLFGVFKANGSANARENIESLVTLSGRIKDVLTGTGEESKKLFAGLSVSAEELSKLPIDEQFFRIHEAIMQLPNPVDRINRLMLAFGEDGGKTLIGTLSKSTAELRAQAKGFALSGEEAEAASKAQAAMNAASQAMTKVWTKIAVTVAPVVTLIADGVARLVQESPGLVKWLLLGAAAVMSLAGGLFVAGTMAMGLSATLSLALGAIALVGKAVLLLTTPVGAATVAVGLLGAALLKHTDAGREALDGLKSGFGRLLSTAKETFGGVKDALAAGDWKLAFEVLTAGLALAWADLSDTLLTAWEGATAGIREGWRAVVNFIASGIASIESAWQRFLAQTATAEAADLSAEWDRKGQERFEQIKRAMEEERTRSVIVSDGAGGSRLRTAEEAERDAQELGRRMMAEFQAERNAALAPALGQADALNADADRLANEATLIGGGDAHRQAERQAARQQRIADAEARLADARRKALDAARAKEREAAMKAGGNPFGFGEEGGGSLGEVARDTAAKASYAVNAATEVGTLPGVEAAVKALSGGAPAITPGEKHIAAAIDRQTGVMDRQHREAMKNTVVIAAKETR